MSLTERVTHKTRSGRVQAARLARDSLMQAFQQASSDALTLHVGMDSNVRDVPALQPERRSFWVGLIDELRVRRTEWLGSRFPFFHQIARTAALLHQPRVLPNPTHVFEAKVWKSGVAAITPTRGDCPPSAWAGA